MSPHLSTHLPPSQNNVMFTYTMTYIYVCMGLILTPSNTNLKKRRKEKEKNNYVHILNTMFDYEKKGNKN